jgi:hypothetical protein
VGKRKGIALDGLIFPILNTSVSAITDWRWYAVRDGDGASLVRRLGQRRAEIRWDGDWWRWEILDDRDRCLFSGQGGRLTQALVAAESAQPYQIPACPTWCSRDHSNEQHLDAVRLHSACQEITIGEGRDTAAVGVTLLTGPDDEPHGGPTVYLSGLADVELTVAETSVLRAALATAIERTEEAAQVWREDCEQHRQARVRQRTSLEMRRYADPLVNEIDSQPKAA